MTAASLPAGTFIEARPVDLPDFAQKYVNLALDDLGATVVSCSDEFFGAAKRCLQWASPVFVAGKFDANGKWMDGWETRRRRGPGHDHAVIRLAGLGRIHGLDIDTSHFSGNHPQAASVEACRCISELDSCLQWTRLLDPVPLSPDSHHFFPIDCEEAWTHVRLNIYPDGGVARFRVYGQMSPGWSMLSLENAHEVSGLALGGRVLSWSDAHFGAPMRLIMPGRGVNMGDGWETRRRRSPGHDWCVIALGHPVEVTRLEIDTAHFKGNHPQAVSVQAAYCAGLPEAAITSDAMYWPELLSRQPTEPDHQHFFEGSALASLGPVSHVRVNQYPDGGISRIRVWGRLVPDLAKA